MLTDSSFKGKAVGFVVAMVIIVAALLAMVIYLMVEVQKLLHPSKNTSTPAVLKPIKKASTLTATSSRKNLKSIEGAFAVQSGNPFQIVNKTVINSNTITSIDGQSVSLQVQGGYGGYSSTKVSSTVYVQTVVPMQVVLQTPLPANQGVVFVPSVLQTWGIQGFLLGTGNLSTGGPGGANGGSYWATLTDIFTDGFFGTVQRSVLFSNSGTLNSLTTILSSCFPSGQTYNFLTPVYPFTSLPENLGESLVPPRTPQNGKSVYALGFVIDGTGTSITAVLTYTKCTTGRGHAIYNISECKWMVCVSKLGKFLLLHHTFYV